MATIDDTVNSIILSARDFADITFQAALDLTGDAVREANSTVLPKRPSFFADITNLPEINLSGQPGRFSGSFTKPTGDVLRPEFQPIYVPDLPTIDSAPDSLDTSNLFNIARPSFSIPEFSDEAPDVDVSYNLPATPDLVFPDAPVGSEISVPDTPQVTLPKFSGELSAFTPSDLVDMEQSYKDAFDTIIPQLRSQIDGQVEEWITRFAPEYHTQLAALEAKLATGIEGGTALSDEIEQAIYDRARARATEAYEQELADAEKLIATSGYPIPPGVVTEIYLQIRSKMTSGIVGASTDVAIERAKIEIQHAQFCIQTSAQLRQSMMNYLLQYNGSLLEINNQAMKYSGDVVDLAVKRYNLELDRYKLEVNVYEITARVYETELKSALADLQAYELEVQALKLRKDIERQDFEIYAQKIEAQKSKVDLYVAQLQGLRTETEAKKLAIDVYAEKIKAHSLIVQGKQYEFRAYEAAINGDTAKVNAYAQEVGAYRSRVEAYRSVAQVEQTKAQVSLESNRNLSAVYETDIRKYLADVQVESTDFDAQVKAYQTAVDAYRADLSAQVEVLRAELGKADLELKADLARYDGELRFNLEATRFKQESIKLQADTAVAAARTLNTMAAEALGSQNTMVTLAAEESI